MAGTITKAFAGAEDISFKDSGTTLATFTRTDSQSRTITVSKVDGAHIQFRTLAKTLDDLVDGGGDVPINVAAITCASVTSAGAISGTAITCTAVTSTGAISGTVITGTTSMSTDTISEYTATAGVTIDGVKLKDSEPYCDVINEKTAATGVTIDGVLLKDSQVTTDTINEKTAATGVTIDTCLIKDGLVANYKTGTSNVGAGTGAFAAIETGGNYNIAIGSSALASLTTGDYNTAIGYQALQTITTVSNNTAIGYQALKATTSANNVAVGYNTMPSANGGTYNTAVGASAMNSATSAASNTGIGGGAMTNLTSGASNVGVGYLVLTALTSGAGNVAIGNSALAATTGSYNVGIGTAVPTDAAGTSDAFVVGNGTTKADEVLIYGDITTNGATNFNGAVNANNFDFGEYFEWVDGNPSNEDRIGMTVVLDGSKIRPSSASDNPAQIIGAISGTAGFVGNAAHFGWQGQFEKDEWGRTKRREVNYVQWNDKGVDHNYAEDEIPDGIIPPDNANRYTRIRAIKVKDFDPELKYKPREKRQEWDIVGLVGQVLVRNGQTVGDRWVLIETLQGKKKYLVRG